MSGWAPIDSAPWDQWIMVKNRNGTKFLASFRLMPGFSARTWYDTEYLLRDPVEWLDDSATHNAPQGGRGRE